MQVFQDLLFNEIREGSNDDGTLERALEKPVCILQGGLFVVLHCGALVAVAMDYSIYRSSPGGRLMRSESVLGELLSADQPNDSIRAAGWSLLSQISEPNAMYLHERTISYAEFRRIRPGNFSDVVTMAISAVPSFPTHSLTSAVVGFGNSLEHLAFDPRVTSVAVYDQDYQERMGTVERVVSSLNDAVGHAKVTFEGSQIVPQAFDVIDISASCFSTGTMDALVSRPDGVRIIDGPSGFLHPKALARYGFSVAVTERRGHDYLDAVLHDPHLSMWMDEYSDRIIAYLPGGSL